MTDSNADELGSVHIIGTGLIGTSVGLALRRAGIDVTISDREPATQAEAEALGAGRGRLPDDPAPSIVIVATPPASVGQVLAQAAVQWPAATLTDVSSVKSSTLADALSRGVPGERLVGGHPMAGREVSGPAGGRSDLFDDRVWVVCPTQASESARIAEIDLLARSCGAVTVTMSPESHDTAVAVTSHAPQVLASVLAARLMSEDEQVIALAGQGLRDMTRIADSDPVLWEGILTWNGDRVHQVLVDVIAELQSLSQELSEVNGTESAAVVDVLKRGVEGRSRIPGKHGGSGRDFEIVSVMVKDEPGELASLFVAAGDLGVNLEDVRIEHVLGRPSGLIDLSVRPQVAQALRDGLTEGGFDVRA